MNLLSICPQRVAVTAQRIMLGRHEPMVWRDSIDAIAMEARRAETLGSAGTATARAGTASPGKGHR